MNIVIEQASSLGPQNIEVVERKGLGHPDTLCDALAEQASIALSQFYLQHCGQILHHNLDKVLLWGGSSIAAFGGGEVIKPIEIFITGRATLNFKGITVPIEKLIETACRDWIRKHFHALDADHHVLIRSLIRPGSSELVDLYMRQQRTGHWLANDTSCGVGYAPLSALENTVLHVEEWLKLTDRKQHPELGQDIKVMGVRRENQVDLTVAVPMIGAHINDMEAYQQARDRVQQSIYNYAGLPGHNLNIEVNAADDPAAGSIYLTVTGTSAESGDDGEAGRGNRANGLITPYRPMTMESVAGKNPVTHVGKLYNIAARSIAERVVSSIDMITAAECVLVSRIGHPVAKPQIVHLRATTQGEPLQPCNKNIRLIITEELSSIATLWEKLISGMIALY